MKLIYIDDSYFQSSSFLNTMRKRLFLYCIDHEVTYLLISGTVHEEDEIVSSFFHDCESHGITIMKNPAVIEFDHGLEGILSYTSFIFSDGRSYHPYSGSALLVDTKHQQVDRIYFELFSKIDVFQQFASLEEELVKMLTDVLKKAKKTKHHYH